MTENPAAFTPGTSTATPASAEPALTQANEPTTAPEARAELFQRPTLDVASAREALASPQTQPRAEDGTFKAVGDAPQAADLTAPDPAAAPAPAELAAPEPGAADGAPPTGFVRIPLSADHPLAAKGATFIDAPKEQENYFRWAVNNAVRREAIVQWEQYAQAQRAENLRLQAQLRATTEFTESAVDDPMLAHMLNDIQTTYGELYPDLAATLRQALIKGRIEPKVNEYVTEAQNAETEARETEVANQFLSQAYQESMNRFPGWSPQEFDAAVASYGALMMARQQEYPDITEFLTHAATQYMQKPEVRARLTQQAREEAQVHATQIAQTERDRLAAEERAKLEAAHAARNALPFRSIPAGMTGVGEVPLAVGATNAKDARASLFNRRRA